MKKKKISKPANIWNLAADMMLNPVVYPNGYPPKKKRKKDVK
jgi:hypothetical protein